MMEINQYTLINQILKLSDNIILWLCEKADKQFELLTIAKNAGSENSLKRLFNNEIEILKNQTITSFDTILDWGIDDENNCYFIVYEYNPEFSTNNQNRANINTVKQLAKGLSELHSRNNNVHIISPKYMKINERGEVKAKFLGLFPIFKQEGLLDKEILAPNVIKWLEDPKQPAPNFQDDIFSLIKSFEDIFKADLNETAIQILCKALEETRTRRFADYADLIEPLEQMPKNIVKKYGKTLSVRVKRESASTLKFADLLDSMNDTTWFKLDSKRSKEKNQITGLFSTPKWQGRFWADEEGYIFIDFPKCIKTQDDKLIKNPNSFIAEFNFAQGYTGFHCLDFFEQKFEEINHLAEANKTKQEAIKIWQSLPEKEQEFIEKSAFKVRYTNREASKTNSNNIKFSLANDTNKKSWAELKRLKNEKVVLFINEQKIGQILDFHPTDKFIIIKDIFCTLEEIPNEGELVEDVRQETSQLKKQVEACKNFGKMDVVNPTLCGILATPEDCELKNVSLQEWDYSNFKDEVFNPKLKNDETQREAVLEALHQKPVYLIQGPPGTGKTTVIVELVQQLIKRKPNVKILVTSQSNLAVDNVLERLIEISEQSDKEFHFMRLASDQTIEKENLTPKIQPHTSIQKLHNWVVQSIKGSEDYLKNKFEGQEKQQKLIDLYKIFAAPEAEKNLDNFKNKLKTSPSDLKKLFANANDHQAIQTIFENNLGAEFLNLKQIQSEWIAFLNNVSLDNQSKSMLNNGSTEIDFLTAMMMQMNVIGATCIHIASSKYKKVNFRFDYVIMDESSKASAAETLVPINMGENIILIGDHHQLPPIITREEAIRKEVKKELDDNGLDFNKAFGKSLFEKLVESFELNKPNFVKMLDIQYRMPKQVGDLISKYFYNGRLKNPQTEVIPDYDARKSHGLKLKTPTSIFFFSSSLRENPNDNGSKTERQNPCNVELIKELLSKLNRLYVGNLSKEQPFTIGIIAGYRGQVELLKEKIVLSDYPNFRQEQKSEGQGKITDFIEINTVDKFQGAERDIMIYDIVRSSIGQSNIGFLDDYRRINVAFSRVKRLLIVVGDSEYLIKRATLNPDGEFSEFKLQQIAKELNEKKLIFNHLNDIFE